MEKDKLKEFLDGLSDDDFKEIENIKCQKIEEEIVDTKAELRRLKYKLETLHKKKTLIKGSGKGKRKPLVQPEETEDGTQELPI